MKTIFAHYARTLELCTNARTLFIQLIYSCISRYQVPTNSVAPSSVDKAYTTHNSSICSNEGLTLETSAFQSLYGGQFTLLTPLINQIFVFHSPTDAAPQFLQKLPPLHIKLQIRSRYIVATGYVNFMGWSRSYRARFHILSYTHTLSN